MKEQAASSQTSGKCEVLMRRICVRLPFIVVLLVLAIPALSQGLEPSPTADYTWILPSVASFEGGAGGSSWTTGITVTNPSSDNSGVTFKFLGHDRDGRDGAESGFFVGPGVVLGLGLLNLFDMPQGFGAVRVTATSPHLIIQSETSTYVPGGYAGTVGQAVPALGPSDFASASPKTLVPINEYESEWTPPAPGPKNSFRTNLVLVNAGEIPVITHVELFAGDGTLLASRDVDLPPLGMAQINRVAASLGAGPVSNGRLTISTPTPGGLVAAYASVIDNISNDPRTVLPR
jgi:hypothetical protein